MALQDDLINLALAKPCQQSSVLHRGASTAAAAVDGVRRETHAFHTDRDLHPWWQVDLGVVVPLQRVVLYNVAGPHAVRAARCVVRVSIDGTNFDEVVYSALNVFGGHADDAPLVLNLAGLVAARHVRVQVAGRNYLHLSQVEVWARRQDIELASMLQSHRVNVDGFFKGRSGRYSEVEYEPGEPTRLDALHVVKFGRFGNIMVCLVNALAVAERMGIGRIFVNTEKLDPGVIDLSRADGPIRILPDDLPERRSAAVLAGSFFQLEAFPEVRASLGHRRRRELAQRYLVPLLCDTIAQRPSLTSSDIVVHFRSGDIFTGISAPSYRQPPLAYYELAVEEARRLGGRTAWVVFEDQQNPTIEPFLEHCRRLGLEVRLPDSSFVQDLGYMLTARMLICPRSTLAEAVMLLARDLQRLWVFEEAEIVAIAVDLGVECRHVRDSRGGYMQIRSWQNTPEQRAQMLEYPRDALVVERGRRG